MVPRSRKLLVAWAAWLTGALSLAASPAADVPEVFAALDHDAALERAVAEERLLLIDFTAVWCGPCKQMDATTWVDETVVDWIGEHALAIQVDVDEHEDVAFRYGIQAMPTVVVLRDGEEFDRVTGYRDGAKLLAWLGEVLEGRTALDALRDVAPDDVKGRHTLAKTLMLRGLDDEASEELRWLWHHALEHRPSWSGVRRSFLARDIEALAGRHAPTREHFAALLDEERRRVDAGTDDRETWREWMALSGIVEGPGGVLRWVDENLDEDGQLPEVPPKVLDSLARLLLRAGRLADAGRLHGDLVALARERLVREQRTRQALEAAGREVLPESLELMRAGNRRDLLDYHRMALAAERFDDAEAMEPIILEAFDEPLVRVDLARHALDMGGAAERHLRLVEEALAELPEEDAGGAELLKAELEQALGG